jgi:hypothetical protein
MHAKEIGIEMSVRSKWLEKKSDERRYPGKKKKPKYAMNETHPPEKKRISKSTPRLSAAAKRFSESQWERKDKERKPAGVGVEVGEEGVESKAIISICACEL